MLVSYVAEQEIWEEKMQTAEENVLVRERQAAFSYAENYMDGSWVSLVPTVTPKDWTFPVKRECWTPVVWVGTVPFCPICVLNIVEPCLQTVTLCSLPDCIVDIRTQLSVDPFTWPFLRSTYRI